LAFPRSCTRKNFPAPSAMAECGTKLSPNFAFGIRRPALVIRMSSESSLGLTAIPGSVSAGCENG
jgi:hypothetical protein